MKKVIYSFLFLILMAGCTYEEEPFVYTPSPETPETTFEEISQPYLDKYGTPEDIYTYDSTCYHTINWWWWSQGFNVGFINTCYDDINGWAVDSEYSFPPI